MVYQSSYIRKKIAKAHVDAIREKLKCSSCGIPHLASPIEFHSFEHDGHRERRVSVLVNRGASIKEIDLEISRCEALCRACHVNTDGRLDTMIEWHRGKYKPIERCIWCKRLYKPLRRELCNTCYDREFRYNWPSSSIVCKRGHYKIGANVYVYPKGQRECKQCRTERDNTPYYRTEEK
jgi:hypothetical protein